MAHVKHDSNDINVLLKKLGKFSASYDTMSPTVKSSKFVTGKCSVPELPPRRREFHNAFYDNCYKGSGLEESSVVDDENDGVSTACLSPNDQQTVVVNSIEHKIVNDQLYAVVDKNIINKKRELKEKGTNQNGAKSQSNLYEVENTNQIVENNANETFGKLKVKHRVAVKDRDRNRRVSDGMINPEYLADGKLRVPPPIPRPYSSEHKWDLPTHMEEPVAVSTETPLDVFRQHSISTDNMRSSCKGGLEFSGKNDTDRLLVSEQHINHHGSRDNFRHILPWQKDRSSSFEGLTTSHSEAELRQLREFKKNHRRMRSHESFDKTFHASTHGNLLDKSLRKSGEINSILHYDKSEEDLGRLLSSSRENGNDVFRDSHSDELAEFFRRASDFENDGLPEGWQEVHEGAETYYWHIWTGTIQYERPTLSQTTGSSSRSISPFSGNGSAHSSRTSSITDPFEEKNVKSSCMSPSLPEAREKTKQSISFPVHSMGWLDVEEELMSPEHIGNTVNNCIETLAEQRHDLWKVNETWANGDDIKLVLEGETLKLIEAKNSNILHVQPIARMRVWGVGRTETRDFAYIARDQSTSKHRCHMFRCHGHLSARSINNALYAICNRVLDEKRKAKERCDSPLYRSTPSDLMKPPARSGNAFNEKPYADQKRCFTAKYVGSSEVLKCSGVDVINKTVAKLTDGQQSSDWSSVLMEVTTSEIRTIDCVRQMTTLEHRVRFISFLGVAHDERFGAYIVATGKECFVCNVFFCAPHAGALMKALEEACKLRFEKMLAGKVLSKPADDHVVSPSPEPESIVAKAVYNPTAQSGTNSSHGKVKEKTKRVTSSIAGVFNKLNKKDSRKKEEVPNSLSSACIPGPNENLVKYFGSVTVDIGTGVDTVQKAVNDLAGGEMMIGYIEILSDCVSLSDSQRTALSKRFFDFNTISYCGMTSDRKHFGIIVSRGKGKYICHVFEEYKVNCGDIVSAIHEVL